MDRSIVYTSAIPQTTDILNTNKFGMVGLAYATHGILGTNVVVEGLACAPTSPTADLHVTVGVGSIYAMDPADATAYGDLGTDTNSIMKQGINYTPVQLTVTPPGTSGFSQVYLVQAILNDVDAGASVLSYFNAANPAAPFSGPANNGMSQFTIRKTVCSIALKAGVAATTGSQTIPAPDFGFTGLYAITVANGQTQITSASIAQLPTAPFFPTLPSVPVAVQDSTWTYAVDSSTGGAPFVTNATTATSSAVLHFASVPSWVTVGMVAYDLTTNAAVTGGQTILSKTGTTVTLSGNVNATVGSGDTIAFSSNAVVASISPLPAALVPGLKANIKLSSTNTGSSTLNLNGLGAVAIHRATGTALAPGDIASGMIAEFIYDGSFWQVSNFEGFNGGSVSNNTIGIPYATGAGTANAITAAFTPAITSLSAGTTIEVKIAITSAGPTTIAVNALSAVNVADRYGAALLPGSLVAGEIAFMIYDGTQFQVVNTSTPAIATNTTFFVNNSTGSDSNNGLTTGTAWATLAHAVSALAKYNLNGNTATIQLAQTGIDYPSTGVFAAPSSGQLVIQGGAGNQSGYVVRSSSGTIVGLTAGNVSLVGLTLINDGTTGCLLQAGGATTVNVSFVTFLTTVASPAPNSLILSGGGATVNVNTGCIFGGSASAMWIAETAGQIIYTANMAVANSPAFSGAAVVAFSCGVVQPSVSGLTWSGTGAFGPRFSATLNGVINTAGAGANFFPGSLPGSTATGGQYA